MGQELSRSECGHPDAYVLESDEDLCAPGPGVGQDFITNSPKDHQGSAKNTVIIFDWDDTLLCSSAINRSIWSVGQLQELGRAAESALRTAMGLGETMIVTNGNATWVQDSSRRFLPNLVPLIEQLTVVSARALYETSYPGDPFMWKRAAFNQLLIRERPGCAEFGLNLIAIGDQQPEIEAAHFVVKNLGLPSQAKTVKFKEGPSIPELVGQLGKAEIELGKIVVEQGSGSRGLIRRQLPPHLEHTVAQPQGWRFSTKEAVKETAAWSFPRSLSLKELWLLFP